MGGALYFLWLMQLFFLDAFGSQSSDAYFMRLREKDIAREKCIHALKEEYKTVVGRHVRGRHALLTDMVTHKNLGDSFIEHGERIFLEEMGTPVQRHCSRKFCNYTREREALREDPRPPVVLIHGGGNFGDVWLIERKHHMEIVATFSEFPVVFLPQSVYFASEDKMMRTRKALRAHRNLTFLVRDLRSLTYMRENFWDNPSYLSPDAAFMIGPLDRRECKPEADVIVLARTDVENATSHGALNQSLDILSRRNISYVVDDWPCGMTNTPSRAMDHAAFRMEAGRKCLCRGRIVVTDRLHAVIMSTLLGLPHVHLDNIYGKIHAYRASHFQPREECSYYNLRAHRAKSWRLAMKKAKRVYLNEVMEEKMAHL